MQIKSLHQQTLILNASQTWFDQKSLTHFIFKGNDNKHELTLRRILNLVYSQGLKGYFYLKFVHNVFSIQKFGAILHFSNAFGLLLFCIVCYVFVLEKWPEIWGLILYKWFQLLLFLGSICILVGVIIYFI